VEAGAGHEFAPQSRRVLVVHNHYRSRLPSGENRLVAETVDMLREAGDVVETYFRHSDEIASFDLKERLALAARPVYSPGDVSAFEARLASFRPDLVQLNNPYPLISPWVIRSAAKAGVPVVQLVHNYRHTCMAGTFFRDGHMCFDCKGKAIPWPGTVHRCYQGSAGSSAVMAAALAVHRSTWSQVTHFVAVSHFVARQVSALGVAPERISVSPNTVPDPGPPPPLGAGFLFAGRLDQTKGLSLLLEAWERAALGPATRLRIAGDGPERGLAEDAARRVPGVSYVGGLSKEELWKAMSAAAVVVVPSVWHEPFGRTVVEAYAAGRPVLATSVGGLPEIVNASIGWVTPPEPAALAAALRQAGASTDLASMSQAARRRYEERYVPAVALQTLRKAHERALYPAQ
jgi:glycosyltransferase involved in cell wall biosynthesis